MIPKCEECQHAIFYKGFEKDPICEIGAGILCKNEKTSRFKQRTSRIILKPGGILALLTNAFNKKEGL